MSALAIPTGAASRRGLIAALASTDHKVIAIRTALVAVVFFLGGGVLAMLIRTELITPGLSVTSYDGYNELFTMHGSTMVYLVMIPVALAACVYFVPLQIGASGLSGARWALAGSWLQAFGGLVMWSGWLTREGPARAGWTSYDPLADAVNTPGNGMDLWFMSVNLVTLGQIIMGACVLATIVRRRAPGMTFLRMPPFTWTALVTVLMVVFSFFSLIGAMTLELIERHSSSAFGGSWPIAYQHLFWFYAHPNVYVMFFPFVGMVAEAAAIFSGRRFFGYTAMVMSLLAFTVLSMSVWGHHMFTTGAIPNKLFSLTSTLLVVPAGIEYFDIIGTLVLGSVRFRTAMLFVYGFLIEFLIGGLSGIFVGSPPLDYHAQDSYIVVSHFHYTLIGGSLFGLFAGLYMWWPKITGRYLFERLGKVHFATMFVGMNMTFIPQLFLGYDGMARRIATYPSNLGWETWNLISSIGAYVLGLSFVLFAINAIATSLRSRTAPNDAWTSNTLEWYTTSPPPRHNFDSLPPIRGYQPLYDLREDNEASEDGHRDPVDTRLAGGVP
jgi:cytochrome c oxidase subunit I